MTNIPQKNKYVRKNPYQMVFMSIKKSFKTSKTRSLEVLDGQTDNAMTPPLPPKRKKKRTQILLMNHKTLHRTLTTE